MVMPEFSKRILSEFFILTFRADKVVCVLHRKLIRV